MNDPMDYFNQKQISQSALARLDSCPHSCLLYAKHRGSEGQSHAQARGSLFHAYAEWHVAECLRSGEEMLPPDVAREQMEQLCDERLDLVIPHFERDALRGMAWNFAEGFVVDPKNPPMTEIDASMKVGDWTVVGRVDWVSVIAERDCYVQDFKTSLAMPSQEDFEKSFQVRLYALLLSEQNPRIDTFHLAETYPRFLSKRCGACGTFNDAKLEVCKECGDAGSFEPPALGRRRMTLGKRDLHDFKRSVEGLLRKLDKCIETGVWPASPDSHTKVAHCSTCPSQPECPLPRSQRPAQITTPDECGRVLADVNRMDADSRRLKAAARAYVKENGEVQVGQVTWGFQTVISNSTDKEAVTRALREGGVDPKDLVKATTSNRFGPLKDAA
jgi:hypothetical protein